MAGPSRSPPPPLRVSPPLSSSRAFKSPLTKSGSATESSDGEDPSTQPTRPTEISSTAIQESPSKAVSQAASRAKMPEQGRSVIQADKTSDDDSSPLRPPPKKAKPARVSSGESDSESERKARIAQLKNASGSNRGGGGAQAKRGVRQPIKRGGKRF